ncbi:MAG: hypothetical protein V3573_08840 [Desulfovibrionaceae bacterium]
MKSLSAVFILLSLLVCPAAHALEFTVSSSSDFMAALGDFQASNLLDNDPATAWAEGVEGEGLGQWVLFEFGQELLLERLGFRNGWQREGDYEANNRPKDIRLVFSNGVERKLVLADNQPWQYFELNVRTDSVRIVIDSVYERSSFLTYNRTCLSDVAFELAMLPGAAAIVATPVAPVVSELPPVDMQAMAPAEASPETNSAKPAAQPVAETAPANPVPAESLKAEVVAEPERGAAPSISELPAVDMQAMGGRVPAPAEAPAVKEGDAVAPQAESAPTAVAEQKPEVEPLDELPAVDMAAMSGEGPKRLAQGARPESQKRAEQLVRDYYKLLVTLDDRYTELYSRRVRNDEVLMFEYFKEMQRQRNVFHLFRQALVDVDQLRFELAQVRNDRAEMHVTGGYTIYVAEKYYDVPVDALFTLVDEEGVWKVLDLKEEGEELPEE